MKGLDLSKFKKVHSDKKSTTLRHKDGHELKIAHDNLSAKMKTALTSLPTHENSQPINLGALGKISAMYAEPKNVTDNDVLAARTMAKGGQVGVAPQYSNIFNNNSRAINKRMYGPQKGENLSEDEFEDGLTGDEMEGLNRGQSLPGALVPQEDVISEEIPSYADGGDVSKPLVDAATQEAINAMPVPADQASTANQGVVGNPTPLATPVNNEDAVSEVETSAGKPMPAFPAYQAPAGGANDPYAVANQTALQGIQKQQEGAQQSAVAIGELGAKEASADAMAADALNSNQTHFQQAYQDLSHERQRLYADFEQGHINPRHYIENMSTGSKIATGLGLIMGGMGSGLTHQPNLAFEYLNNQINRDVDAQKTNLQNKSTLLNSNLAQTGNLFHATELTRMQTLDINSMHLKQIAAASQDPIQRANLLGISGKLDQEASTIQAQIAQRQALMQTYGGGDQEQAFQQRMRLLKVMGQDKFAEGAEKRHVPGVGDASREVPAEALAEMATRQDFDTKVQDLQNFAQQNSGSINPATIKQGKAKAQLVQDAYRRANKQGVFKESENEFVNGLIADPTQILSKYRGGKGYQELRRDNLSSLNSIKQSYGLPVTQQQSGDAQGTPNIQKRGDSYYQKVPGGWKKVK